MKSQVNWEMTLLFTGLFRVNSKDPADGVSLSAVAKIPICIAEGKISAIANKIAAIFIWC